MFMISTNMELQLIFLRDIDRENTHMDVQYICFLFSQKELHESEEFMVKGVF